LTFDPITNKVLIEKGGKSVEIEMKPNKFIIYQNGEVLSVVNDSLIKPSFKSKPLKPQNQRIGNCLSDKYFRLNQQEFQEMPDIKQNQTFSLTV